MGQSSQKSVKIDSVLWDELDRWLESSQAEKLGFHSKAQFVTQAVREMLDIYAIKEITVSTKVYNKFHQLFQKNKKELYKKGITSFSGYVTNMLEEMMQKDKSFARYPPKIEKIYIEDDKVVLKDNVKNRIAEVVVKRGELFCELCKAKDCVHVGYILSLPDVRNVLNIRKIKNSK